MEAFSIAGGSAILGSPDPLLMFPDPQADSRIRTITDNETYLNIILIVFQ
jgi:hypothetical protein